MLSNYIKSMNLDLDPHEFYKNSKEKGIEPTFALATWSLETGYGSSFNWTSNNNPAGIKCGGDYCVYESKEQGLNEMFKLLENYTTGSIEWVGKRTTIKSIREKWSEADDAYKILEIMRGVIYG